MAALNKLLLIVLTDPARDLRIEILCSVTQLHENVKKALHTTGLNDPGAFEHVAGLKVPEQYGDQVLKSPEQQKPLLHVGGLNGFAHTIELLHVGGLNPDG